MGGEKRQGCSFSLLYVDIPALFVEEAIFCISVEHQMAVAM
jgi:hypothetical protein